MLQGCGSGMVKQSKKIDLPSEMMRECEEAYVAKSEKFSDLFRNHIEVRGQYEECKTRHNALVDRIKELNSK